MLDHAWGRLNKESTGRRRQYCLENGGGSDLNSALMTPIVIAVTLAGKQQTFKKFFLKRRKQMINSACSHQLTLSYLYALCDQHEG